MAGPPVGSRTVVVPMYREAGRISRSVVALRGSDLHSPTVELLFVDDGSDDATIEVLEEALETTGLQASVLRQDVNKGKGSAVRAGMLKARGGAVAFTDADLSTPPADVVRALEVVESGAADVVVATRTHSASRIPVPQPTLRRLSGKCFNLVLRLLRLAPMRDTQCGLKAFTAAAAHSLFAELITEGFSFDVEVLLRARRLGLRVVELPVEWSHFEDSRVRPLADSLRMLVDVIALRLRLRRQL